LGKARRGRVWPLHVRAVECRRLSGAELLVMGDASNRPEGLYANASARVREGSMTNNTPARACPKCGSTSYTFRSRKQIEATPEQEAMLETKYRCRACEHEWKEKVPGMLRKALPPE
jgi:hypothetical protein